MSSEKNIYGCEVDYSGLRAFLEHNFRLNEYNAKIGSERFATCIWSKPGLGKTSVVKQLASHPVTWRDKQYPGYNVTVVPLAQIEEVGDLLGMPCRHVKVSRNGETKWVATEVLGDYTNKKWIVDENAGVRMMYAAPDWCPTEEGPGILVFDDFNRAGLRVIKAIMQLLQDYGTIAWKLPEGTHIVMTANPDGDEYMVTSLDSAIMQRMRSVQLSFKADEWAVWAQSNGIHQSVIAYTLQYPEMISGGKVKTSPRSIAEFGRYLTVVNGPNTSCTIFRAMGESLLDEETVNNFVTFLEKDFIKLASPEGILDGDKTAWETCEKYMSGKETRNDILAITLNRLFAFMVQRDLVVNKNRINNFRTFIKSKFLVPEIRHALIQRMVKFSQEKGGDKQWRDKILGFIVGDIELNKVIAQYIG